jgi:uncharacterized coiled-coil DUF342 family protein
VDLPTAVEKYWAHFTAAAAGVWIVVKALWDRWDKRRADAAAAKAAEAVVEVDLARLTQDAVGKAVQILREEVERISETAGRLSDELEEVRAEVRELHRMIATKDAELALAYGKIRQLEAENEALRRRLLALGERPELPFQAAEIVADGTVKTMGEA